MVVGEFLALLTERLRAEADDTFYTNGSGGAKDMEDYKKRAGHGAGLERAIKIAAELAQELQAQDRL